MKQYDEIKDIILNRLGLTNLDVYNAWVQKKYETNLSQEEIDLLSPDNIDNNAFWRVAEEIFKTNPVCNGREKMHSVNESNIANLRYARASGILNPIDLFKSYKLSFLEIGAGYGSLREYINTHTDFNYTGTDVYPKTHEIVSCKNDGHLSEDILSKNFDMVVSSNVFQHLSEKQREKYYKDVHAILRSRGAFIFNLIVDTLNSTKMRGPDGAAYMSHYGQFTKIERQGEIVDKIISTGYRIRSVGLMDGYLLTVWAEKSS